MPGNGERGRGPRAEECVGQMREEVCVGNALMLSGFHRDFLQGAHGWETGQMGVKDCYPFHPKSEDVLQIQKLKIFLIIVKCWEVCGWSAYLPLP